MTSPRILLDGATGTELERRGARMSAPLWSAHALLDAPALVRQIHLEYAEAGAQVLTTNTFRTHARNLAAGGLADRAAELTTLAVRLAIEARDAFTRSDPEGAGIRIAGSISPLGDCFRPADSPGADAGPEHRLIARQLVDAGADLLLIETMARIDEARAAVQAAQGLGRPIWLAVVARADGRLLAGEPLRDLLTALAHLDLQALLLNCTDLSHLDIALPALVEATAHRPDLWLGTYPHTGHHDPVRGWQTHAIDAEAFAAQLTRHADTYPRLSLLGACCGSTPAWIDALAHRIQPAPEDRSHAFDRLDARVPRAPTPNPPNTRAGEVAQGVEDEAGEPVSSSTVSSRPATPSKRD